MTDLTGVWKRPLIPSQGMRIFRSAADLRKHNPQVYGGTARWKRLLQRPMRTATEAKFNDVVTTLKEQMQAAWALQGSQPQAPCAPACSDASRFRVATRCMWRPAAARDAAEQAQVLQEQMQVAWAWQGSLCQASCACMQSVMPGCAGSTQLQSRCTEASAEGWDASGFWSLPSQPSHAL